MSDSNMYTKQMHTNIGARSGYLSISTLDGDPYQSTKTNVHFFFYSQGRVLFLMLSLVT